MGSHEFLNKQAEDPAIGLRMIRKRLRDMEDNPHWDIIEALVAGIGGLALSPVTVRNWHLFAFQNPNLYL